MRRAVVTALLLLCAACGTSEPAATVQPSEGRSLLPPSSSPDDSPSPSPSSDAAGMGSGGNGADAAGADSTPAAAPVPTPKPTAKPTKKPEQPGISGSVVAAGQPVTDAQVTISGNAYHHNTTTSSQGRFQSATPPGTYTVAANSPSVSGCGAKTVTVQPNAVSNVTITCGS